MKQCLNLLLLEIRQNVSESLASQRKVNHLYCFKAGLTLHDSYCAMPQIGYDMTYRVGLAQSVACPPLAR